MVKNKHYYKEVSDGFIHSVGYGYGAPEISEEEYQQLRGLLLNAPEVGDDEEARLREDFSWEVRKVKEEQDYGSNEV